VHALTLLTHAARQLERASVKLKKIEEV